MSWLRRVSVVVAVAAGMTLPGAVAATASPAPSGTPTATITQNRASGGTVHLVLNVSNLPQGYVLDPKSVVVKSGSTVLHATATLEAAGSSDAPARLRETMLVLDTSGSMAGDGIKAAHAAAIAYANSLPPDVRLGLVTFAATPRLLLAPTTDRAALSAAVGQATAGGSTALYDGLLSAASAMQHAPSGSALRVLVLSDGSDTASRHKLADALKVLGARGVTADVVAFRLPRNIAVLDRIASATHGQVLPAAGVSDLGKAFTTAAKAFQQQAAVTVQVPAALSGKSAPLVVAMDAGPRSITAATQVSFPVVSTPKAQTVTGPLPVASAASSSPVGRWVAVGIAFVAMLVLALLLIYAPAARGLRSRKQSRLAEVGRYRLVSSAGSEPEDVKQKPAEKAITKVALGVVDKLVRARGVRQGITDKLDRAGLRIRPEEWAVLQVCAVIVAAAVVTLLTHSIIGVLVGGVLGWLACRMFINFKISRRAKAFAAQLPDMLQLVAGSLRAGFSLNQGIAAVVHDGEEPVASEISRALAEVRLGATLEDALDGVAERMQCEDLHWVVLAIRISREVGGNLAEVLGNTVATMRERAQIRGQIRVLSAEGRISARILIGLPFIMAGYLLLINPSYLRPLYTTAIGLVILLFGAVLLAVGSFWIKRLVRIEV